MMGRVDMMASLVAGLGAMLVAVGCGGSGAVKPQCAKAGCTTGIVLHLEGAAVTASSVHVCALARCRDYRVERRRYVLAVLPMSGKRPPPKVAVTVLLKAAHRVIGVSRREVSISPQYRNGRDCGITCYMGRLAVEATAI
jgi:hypothetical protein